MNRRWSERDERPPDGLSLLNLRSNSDCTPRVVSTSDVCCGRVEDGRGSLGSLAIAPFPIPAHQTGRADFRHPAFRLASPRDMRRGRSGQALEARNAEFSMNDIECKSAIAAPLHLVPSRERTCAIAQRRIDRRLRYALPREP